ncbi:MAG: hypothetical protein IJU59_03715, partial [Firmicutes bacterium]|nr:hypothetical protein [Bacillota bacterium]
QAEMFLSVVSNLPIFALGREFHAHFQYKTLYKAYVSKLEPTYSVADYLQKNTKTYRRKHP